MALLLLALLLAAVASADDCPDSWTLSGHTCYWISTFDVPWASVASICSLAQPSSTPASVHNLATNADLKILLQSKPAWLGLSRPRSWGDWSWQDGTKLDFQYWDSGEPNRDGNCAYINHDHVTGQWSADDCGIDKPAVCQIPAACPEGWSGFQGKCYSLSGDVKVTGDYVATGCSSLLPGAVPVSIHSDDQNAFLVSLQTVYDDNWIGLTRTDSSAAWTWSDGSPLDYLNWLSQEPGSYDLCAFTRKGSYGDKWVGSSCTYIEPFFCQVDM